MKQISIRGGVPLKGQVRIQGSKNAALPVLAATLLMDGVHEIKNCPRIADVYYMLELLKSQGVVTCWKGRDLYVDTRHLHSAPLLEKKEGSMRSSVFLLGSLLGRFHEADMEYPGGCVIGNRPVNWHIAHLSQMGVMFCDSDTRLIARVKELTGCEHKLTFPSVGVTENLMLAAALAKGETRIRNAAKEPEIAVLGDFLNSAGARVEGAGKENVRITGVETLKNGSIVLPGDRIVAGTYALACMITGGEVLLEHAPISHMNRLIPMLDAMGGQTFIRQEDMYVSRREKLCALPYTETESYPGFPTDLQSQLMAVLSVAEGESVIEERIFENRFRIVPELKKMGADIYIKDRCACIRGVEKLHGASLKAEELRGGAALVLAGLAAGGETYIENCGYIYRGYENICRDLTELGARIYSE